MHSYIAELLAIVEKATPALLGLGDEASAALAPLWLRVSVAALRS